MMKFDHLRSSRCRTNRRVGYGAELQDPDGYLIRLWDERSMRENNHLVVALSTWLTCPANSNSRP